MAAPGTFSVKVNDKQIAAVIARLSGIAEAGPKWGKETAERAAKMGGRAMMATAPDNERGDLPPLPGKIQRATPERNRPPLKRRIIWEREAKWSPGGAGGGGSWQAQFGVGGVGIMPVSHDPAFIYRHGSGLFADATARRHGASGQRIEAKDGGVLTFMDRSLKGSGMNQGFAQWVRGQRPNEAFVTAGKVAARAEIRRRIVEFDRALR